MKIIYLFMAFLAAAGTLFLYGCSGDSPKAIRVGDSVASFSGTDLKGNTFSLDAFKDKPVVMRFFLTNCEYCKADTPMFNSFYEKYKNAGLAMVYINNNGTTVEEVNTFARNLNIDFPVIYDPQGKIANMYNVKIQPLTLVLSPGHKLLGALLGGVSEPELQELLNPYLQ